ncbi:MULTISPECIES: hypothetical protein [Kitasatospora]|uniref:Chitin-binding type-3 domain-containing protein n=1 Tax=Kitasatospora setae (strain ATCC 33774 / DSM 43861 / JCM 3304 / KCC A-0304 / NBRC 14216 / KM-6054) TaxID=452652 RepID=E4NJM8_KITSK|nr:MULTISPECIES: hypothetical protein [Kitasatospora]BAJ33176.1 hypothetical protein KSE_74210 [Kitasatospora setae KM-6054]
MAGPVRAPLRALLAGAVTTATAVAGVALAGAGTVHAAGAPSPSPSPSASSVLSPAIQVQVNPSSGTLAPGSSATASVGTAIINNGSYTSIALTVSGAPAGVSASVNPSSVSGSSSAALSVSTGSAVVPGTYTLTVNGVLTGTSATSSATYTLTVTAPACPAAPWVGAQVYTGGATVSWKGHQWSAKWWTLGEEPGTTGQWGVWQDLGSC